jgi:hypothetical protein
MTIEQQIKSAILEQYKSVRAFTITTNIPYSTIDNMLKKGIVGTGIQTVLKVCHALNIDVESIESGIIKKSPVSKKSETRENDIQKDRLIINYEALNDEGREKLAEQSDMMVRSGMYIKNNQSDVCAEA